MLRHFQTVSAAVFAAALMAGCSGDHTHTSGGIEVTDAYVRPPIAGRNISAGYFTIENHGEADVLLSASTEQAGKVEIHNVLPENGVMKMRRVEGVELGHGETVTFKSGSYHLMIFETAFSEEDGQIEMTLEFENSGPMTVAMIISDVAPNAASMKDHSGH